MSTKDNIEYFNQLDYDAGECSDIEFRTGMSGDCYELITFRIEVPTETEDGRFFRELAAKETLKWPYYEEIRDVEARFYEKAKLISADRGVYAPGLVHLEKIISYDSRSDNYDFETHTGISDYVVKDGEEMKVAIVGAMESWEFDGARCCYHSYYVPGYMSRPKRMYTDNSDEE